MLDRLFTTVGSLGGPWAYLAVGLLAAGESSLGVGLVVPGETGMIVGGFVVSQGNADFWLMWVVALSGAILGDSVGYEIGRRMGPRIRRTRIGARLGEERWERAELYVADRGGRAVFVGRFVAVVRSLVPAMAGITRMPYRKFFLWNALGGVLWVSIYLSIGYFAGRSYDRFSGAAEGAGYVVLSLVVLLMGVVMGARWVAHSQDRVRALRDRAGAWPPFAWAGRNFGGPIRFVQRRFEIDDPFGLSLTMGLVALILAAWALAVVTSDVSAATDIVDVDLRVADWFASHRSDAMTSAMEWATRLGDPEVLWTLLTIVALAWLVRTRRWGVALFLLIALAGAVVGTDVIKQLVERPRPPARLAAAGTDGFAFPSGHTVMATVAFGALAYIHGSVVRAWTFRVTVWAVAMLGMVLVGFSRAYLGVHWLSDVLGGFALGAAWLAIVITAFGTSTRFHRQYMVGGRAVHKRSATSRAA